MGKALRAVVLRRDMRPLKDRYLRVNVLHKPAGHLVLLRKINNLKLNISNLYIFEMMIF
jgi:hypothetical protein